MSSECKKKALGFQARVNEEKRFPFLDDLPSQNPAHNFSIQ